MKKINVHILLIIIAVSATVVTGCETQHAAAYRYNNSYSGGFEAKYRRDAGDMAGIAGKMKQDGEDKFSEKLDAEKKYIIYNAYITLKAKQPDTAAKRVENIAARFGGYVQRSGTSQCIIRVESSKLNDAIASIDSLGKVSSKSVIGEDATAQHTDLTIRLENAQKARERYLELLAKAANVDEALKVEVQLERLNGEIDRLKAQLQSVEHLSSYSTITVYIQQKKKPGILSYPFIGLYYGIKWLFVRG